MFIKHFVQCKFDHCPSNGCDVLFLSFSLVLVVFFSWKFTFFSFNYFPFLSLSFSRFVCLIHFLFEYIVKPTSINITSKPKHFASEIEYSINCEVDGSIPETEIRWTQNNRPFKRGKVSKNEFKSASIPASTWYLPWNEISMWRKHLLFDLMCACSVLNCRFRSQVISR